MRTDLIDEIVAVSDADAEDIARRLARVEGILGGVSSGANVVAALQLARSMRPSSRVVTIVVDTGLKYLQEGIFG